MWKQVLLDNKAMRRKSCHQAFNYSMLERAAAKRRKASAETDDQCHLKCQASAVSKNLCILCEEGRVKAFMNSQLTMQTSPALKKMGTDMLDRATEQISGGDIVAREAKFHLNYMTEYCN